jgi:hypothetical protein
LTECAECLLVGNVQRQVVELCSEFVDAVGTELEEVVAETGVPIVATSCAPRVPS